MGKTDTYQLVTDRIVQRLEEGTVPWVQSWEISPARAPRSVNSGELYRGVNRLMLGIEASVKGYGSPYWLTFKEATRRGACVRKGEKGTPIIFWQLYERAKKGSDKTEKVPLLRHYWGFNAQQIEGELGLPELAEAPKHETTPIESAERIVADYLGSPRVKHGSDVACYRPSADEVLMPDPESFVRREDYYNVLFHELTHSTGHSARLNRQDMAAMFRFGDRSYSREELTAELGAAFLCSEAGIVDRTVDQSAAYIAGWLRKLRSDKRLVVSAASLAEKAARWILGDRPTG